MEARKVSIDAQVRHGGLEVMAHHPGHTLLLCWPPLEDGEEDSSTPSGYLSCMGLEAVRSMRGGGALVYIGEWRGMSGFLSQLSWRTATRHRHARRDCRLVYVRE